MLGDWQGDPGSGWDVAGTTNTRKTKHLLENQMLNKGTQIGTIQEELMRATQEWIVYPQKY